MKRKIYSKLLEWKRERAGSTALLIEGARRVGKSFIVEEFARNEYETYMLINFGKVGKPVKDLFDDLTDIPLLLQRLSSLMRVKLHERRSLIIFDEVQMFPRARESIKFLVEDGRYDYIETGSLSSIHENMKDIVIPSEEEPIEMELNIDVPEIPAAPAEPKPAKASKPRKKKEEKKDEPEEPASDFTDWTLF